MFLRISVKKIIFVVALFQCLSLVAMAQGGTGAIGGTVQDPTGAVIPGATVILVNPGIIGGTQQAVTDERGDYQFVRLIPAAYSVRAELPGFSAALRENVVVNADVTARVDLKLEVGSLTDTVTVAGDAVLLDTTTALNQTVLDRSVIDTLPSRNDLWVLARTVPAVVMDRYDVGGSEGYQDANASLHGANQASEGAYKIDGMEMGSGSGAGGGLALYIDVFAFEEVNYQAGGASAESERGGLVYSMVTKTGTNDFHGAFQFSGMNKHLQADNRSPELKRDLLAQVPPSVLAVNPNLDPSAKVLGNFDAALNVSGPIVRNRLWFAGSAQLGSLNQLRVGSYNPDGTQYVDDNRRKVASIKLSAQLTPTQRLHFYHVETRKHQYHVISGTVFAEGRATRRQSPNDKATTQLSWNGTLSPNLLAELSANYFRGPNTFAVQPGVENGDIPAFDAVTNTNSVAAPTYQWAPQNRTSGYASLSYFAGSHDWKFGYQYMSTMFRDGTFSLSHYPAGLQAVFRNGVPDSVRTYNTPVTNRREERHHGLYLQDKWKATKRLTLNYGLRMQKTNGTIPAACQAETIFIAGQCFDRIDNVPDFLTLSPRFALIYDIFGDGKMALKLAANRYDIGTGVGWSNRVIPVKVSNDTRTWIDRNNDLIPQLSELGPSSGFNIGTTNRYNPDVKRPYSNELSVELERQLPGEVVVSVGYYHHEVRNNVGAKNLLVPLESYTPIEVTEVNSGQKVTVYNQSAATRGLFDVLYDNFPELDSQYNGVDVTFSKRLSDRWMVMGGFSYGRNKGDVFNGTDLNNPNSQFRRGVLESDVPVALKLSGLYQLPYGIDVSGSAQLAQGLPERQTVSVGRNTVNLTQTTQVVDISPRGTSRLPNVNMVDLSVRKTFNVREDLSIKPVMDVFNILNSSTPTARLDQLGPTYHRVAAMLRGRMVKFGFIVSF